jgi:vacuolar-type H+-ATPase subunit H
MVYPYSIPSSFRILYLLIVCFLCSSVFSFATGDERQNRIQSFCRGVGGLPRAVSDFAQLQQRCLENSEALVAANEFIGQVLGAGASGAVAIDADSSQEVLLRQAGDLSAVGSQLQGNRAEVSGRINNLVTTVDNSSRRALAEIDQHRSNSAYASYRPKLNEAARDFANIRTISVQQSRLTQMMEARYRASQQQLNANALETQRRAEGLQGGGQPRTNDQGVSTNTLVGLGGTALIVGGGLVGAAVVGSHLIKQGNKAAEQRIGQAELAANRTVSSAEESAKRTIKEAEESAKRIIQFANDSANNIIANMEAASKRIMDDIKKNADELIKKVEQEVKDAVKNLSSVSLTKLKSEVTKMFDDLIEKAKSEGNLALQQNLERAKKQALDEIDAELRRRGLI